LRNINVQLLSVFIERIDFGDNGITFVLAAMRF